MSVAARFVLPLLVVLAILTWVSSRAIQRITDGWVERDLSTRAELAVASARDSLVPAWQSSDRTRVQRFLNGLIRDERIVGAVACDTKARPIALTPRFPGPLSCERLSRDLWRAGEPAPGTNRSWFGAVPLYGQEVHVSAVPLYDDSNEPLGFVALVHDSHFEEQRRSTIQRILLFAFATLTAVASLLMAIVARLSWHNWLRYVRRLLRGDQRAAAEATARPEFSPIAQDVRELISRISEDERTGPRGRWTPDRLREILRSELVGEKVIIVANREPYIHDLRDRRTAAIEVVHPASGLVTALEPVMRACSGVWVAHGSGSADRETADADGRVRVPPGEETYTAAARLADATRKSRATTTASPTRGCGRCVTSRTRARSFAPRTGRTTRRSTRSSPTPCATRPTRDDPIVLVQDYHFALLPRMMRERLPRATILTFWHIPWPNAERFGICPWREELLEGLLGSSILGFHTQLHCNNFLDAVDRFIEARIDRERTAVVHARAAHAGARPIRSRSNGRAAGCRCCRRSPSAARSVVRASWGCRDDALIGVGVDRLDYTKGIEERFLAVERMLERYPRCAGASPSSQLAAPSRTEIERYQRAQRRGSRSWPTRINERFGSERQRYRPIVLLRAHHEPPTVFRYYRAADLCYVSSLHDGMNLVAKEFVAARDDERGVLVLSQFTGAARELTEALIVNPYDIDEASAALATALRMSADEQRERMRAMRALVAEFNVYRWAGRMLLDAARLRRRERLIDRLAENQISPPLF